MCFKRSTRSIVTGKRPSPLLGGPDQQPDITAVSRSDGPEQPHKPNFIAEVNAFMSNKLPPRWGYWAAGIGVAVAVILTVIILASASNCSGTAGEPAVPEIGADQTVISVQADEALAALANPGDIVQLYAADGSAMEELRYLRVYSPAEDGRLLLLVNSQQASAIATQELSSSVVLVCHKDPDRASELLALQERINDPTFKLELQPTAVIEPNVPTKLTYLAEIDPIEATLPQIIWSSSDPNIVIVENGTLYGMSVGEATITAECGDLKASCVVTVEIPLEAIQINYQQAALAIGDTLKIAVWPVPDRATNFDITWASSDPAVATISDNGTVTAIAPGTVTVTATCGDISAQCAVQVGYHAEVIKLDLQSISLAIDQQYKLTPTVYPTTDLIDKLEYSISDDTVATVSDDGTVTAVASGTAVITLRCGNIRVKCTVIVLQ